MLYKECTLDENMAASVALQAVIFVDNGLLIILIVCCVHVI